MKKSMKKSLALLICVVMVFSVAGISGSTTSLSTVSINTQRANANESTAFATDVAITTNIDNTLDEVFAEPTCETCDCPHNPLVVVPGITDSDVALLDAEGNPVLRSDGKPYIKGGFMIDDKITDRCDSRNHCLVKCYNFINAVIK
jgi:hypothetical protein